MNRSGSSVPTRRGSGPSPGLRGVLLGVGVLGALALVVAAVSAGLTIEQEEPFPHETHSGLFPVCSGCHQVPEPGEEPGFPEVELCARCHDGVDLDRVSWAGPRSVPSNVAFDHAVHGTTLESVGESEPGCEACHSEPGGPRMRVEDRVREDTCFACHASGAQGHFGGVTGDAATCQFCHVPMASSEFPVGRIQMLPVPEDHQSGSFLGSDHGIDAAAGTARCATCHTQDRCLTCHVDAANEVVLRVPPAPPGMALPAFAAGYPVPESHDGERFAEQHAPSGGAATCATCHTTDDCRSCHVGAAPAVVDALPARADVSAPGVGLARTAPDTHGSPFFMEAHTTLAAANDQTCATCHTEGFCVDCHNAPTGGSYHPGGFVAGHAAVAFGRADECASCHETATFCRSCHIDSGLGSDGRLGAGYHDAEPVWLLRHGQAARQNLESCASCHQQSDCVQCHSVLGSFKVSPHRPGFDAAASWARSPRTCLACHVGNPLSGGGG